LLFYFFPSPISAKHFCTPVSREISELRTLEQQAEKTTKEELNLGYSQQEESKNEWWLDLESN
jgi:hypothetical protein